MKNKFIDVPAFYRPLITEAVQAWADQEVFVIFDGCLVNHEAPQFFRLSRSHCFRAIPLTWLTVKGPGLITVEKCEALLTETAPLLRQMASVTFCPCPPPAAGVGRCVTLKSMPMLGVQQQRPVQIASGAVMPGTLGSVGQ